MTGKQIVVYRARTVQDAHMLKNVLEEAGIRALVTNEVLANGAGVDILGWPSLAQVVVDEVDAPVARAMAADFDRRENAAHPEGEVKTEPPANAPATNDWPTCPQCGKRRMTSCPACHTSGTHFPPADPVPEEIAEGSSPGAAMRICPTCDEPFVPQYLPVCEWCGHRFEDDQGPTAKSDQERPEPIEPTNRRVTAALWALVVFVAAVVLYFVIMWR